MATKKKTTIKDIANVLGITPSAVSKALSNHPRISDKTKTAVLQIAQNLNYQPNHLASALRKGKSNLVGVIIPKANSHFFSSIIEKIEEVLNEKGYNVIIAQSNESYNKECKSIDALLYTQVDGIIASMANETVKLDYYEKIKSKGIPLILFDRGENDLNVDYVGIDDYLSSHLVIEHLVEQGCKRIAHIAGFSHTRIYKNRIRGYRDALEKFGLPIEDSLIIESNLGIEDGRRIMQQLLEQKNKPDAVYAAGDYAALGALQVLQENHINVPEDIALVGFTNEPFTSLVTPSITSVEQHSEQIGKVAAETLLKRLDSPNEKVSLNKLILPAELIIRSSSKKLINNIL
ncbi:LacI family DNA-binding transcriptional regulator [Confluentibacter flavum]|uniref:LacI family transcriptional regulator n=1 Tax=Confluentibacter flavum TaxID=1909700 RepID=A0A2N3HFP6_9FLAO|nr:LacI family DNA-binding transcriptional regulator [Confluentibacter flavum]PKQ43598.1 LacI family transcriptional regulator [Confluentibacter flavum]